MDSNNRYDVIIIGAGMPGLLTAYYLKQAGKEVLILEAKETASGQTGRTTAKITSQHGMKYTELTDKINIRTAYLYARANEEAIDEYEKLINKEEIDCNFKRVSSYLYTRDKDKVDELKREAELAALYNINAYFMTKAEADKTELPFNIEAAVCFENQAQFDADSFVKHLAGQLNIKEHTQVRKIKGTTVTAMDTEAEEEVVLSANHIVVTAHYPFKNMPGFYFLRQHQEKSYVAALSGCEKIDGMYYGIGKDGISLRQKGDILLFGGCGRRTGEHTCADSFQKLLEQVKEYYPEAKVEDIWSAQDCMPHDGIPFIGRYSIFTPHLYVATGFQKWGMSASMVAALLLRDEICAHENERGNECKCEYRDGHKSECKNDYECSDEHRKEYKEVFSPQRIHSRAGWSDFITDVAVSTKGLWNGFWKGVIKKEIPRCTHLGCGLHFNKDENKWECPCHGSTFDADGSIRDNPAKRDLRLDKVEKKLSH